MLEKLKKIFRKNTIEHQHQKDDSYNGFTIKLKDEVVTRDNINKFIKGSPKTLEDVIHFFKSNYIDIEQYHPMYPQTAYKDGKRYVGAIPNHKERFITLDQLEELEVKIKKFDNRLKKDIFSNNFSITSDTIDDGKYFWFDYDNWIELYDHYLLSIAKFPNN